MKKIVYLISLFAVCFSLNAHSQDNSVITKAVTGLKSLLGDHIIEKAYLHFDKPYYAAGDTIYFKAYVTLGEHYELSEASGMLHVDLINPNNTIVNSIILQLTNGVGWGDFSLPSSMPKGNYRIRAYTRYMQNDPDYFFDKVIPVGSIINGNTAAVATTQQGAKADIQFFPEGGELVSAMVSKVAFKAIGPNGLGVNVKGVVTDNTNAPIATFASSHLGMGTFLIAPEQGKTYKAKVTFADGSQNTFDLPTPAAKGIVLDVKDTLDKISIEIRCNKAYLQDNMNKNISLVMYGSGIVNTVNTKLDSRVLGMDIPNSQFPSGIVQVTLFSETGEPLSERLVFVQGKDLVNLDVNSSKTTYGKRERVSINVNAKDNGANAEGHFSVAVIDESKVPYDENNETTILTYLLLTSDLRGYIEQPNYYFAHKTNQTYADLDALMLTQGYRRYTWKQLLSDNNSKFSVEPEKTIEITGTAKTASGSPVSNMDVMLLTSNNGSMLGDRTDKDGRFKFLNIQPFADNTIFTLQATGSTLSRNTTVFKVDEGAAAPAVDNINIPGLQSDVNSSMIAYLSNSQARQGAVYSNITVNQKAGDHRANQVVAGEEIRGANSLTTALSDHLSDVKFVQDIPYLKNGSSKDPMLVVINGKVVGSYINLNTINPGDVEKVEVLEGSNADAYGVYGSSGVLAITSRAEASKDIMQNASYKYPAKNVVTENVYNANDKNNYQSSNYGGSGHADQVIKGDALKNSTSLSQGLSGLLNGVSFTSGTPFLPGNIVFSGQKVTLEPMYVVLDGSPYIPTGQGIDDISPLSVETVEILKGANASMYGMNGGAGVMVITTRKGVSANGTNNTTLGSLAFKPKGFYMAREFYSPKYENTTYDGHRDLRSTIYWNPELVTNKDGNGWCEFYNADGAGTYRVVIEGIDDKGNIGRQVYRYKVE